jgi:hypothetical protein
VLFCSDNGPHEEGGLNPDSYAPAGPLRGYKRNLYEGGLRVPMVAWSPYLFRHRAGRADAHVWANHDLLPTIASLAGAPVPADLDGRAMDALFTGGPTGTATAPQHPYLYFSRLDPYQTTRQNAADGGRGLRLAEAVRRGPWKAVRFSPDTTRSHPDSAWRFELYHLGNDQSETSDVAAANPSVAAQLLADMKAAWSPGEYRRAAWTPPVAGIDAPWFLGPGASGPVSVRLTNTTGATMSAVTLHLGLPAGWTAVAAGATAWASLAPGAAVTARWTVRSPAGAAAHAGLPLAGTASWAGGTAQVATTVRVPPPAPATDAFLSDLAWMSAGNGWGTVERDRSNGEAGPGDGRPMTIGGVAFAKGLGCHAPSDLWYHLGGVARRFTATIGVDDETGSAGSVDFQVWGDGRRLFRSGRMTGAQPGRVVEVDVSGVQVLALVVTTVGDGDGNDHANWGAARIYR